MNIRTKKNIATEILILVGTSLFCLLGSLGIYFFVNHQTKIQLDRRNQNKILNNKISSNKLKIEKLEQDNDSLYYLYKTLKALSFDVPRNYKSFRETLVGDTQNRIKYFKYLKKNQYATLPATYSEFNKIYFIRNNSSLNSSDSMTLHKLQNEISLYQKAVEKTTDVHYNTDHLIFLFCLISFILVYPIRGIVVLTKWSIQTVRK